MSRKLVDTAIVVSVGPLIDDTDFKTQETTVAYDAAGMSVTLFQETDGAVTATALTLTTGGANDWTHKGEGIYELEITAAQNNAAGSLWVEGIADGVLPFGSPRVDIVAAKSQTDLYTGVVALVTIGNLTAAQEPANRTAVPIRLDCFENEARTFVVTVTADGVAVDLTALTLRFVAQDDQVAPATVFTVEDGSITKTAAGVASILVPAASTATPRTDLTWFLRDVSSDDQVLAWGSMNIYPANTS